MQTSSINHETYKRHPRTLNKMNKRKEASEKWRTRWETKGWDGASQIYVSDFGKVFQRLKSFLKREKPFLEHEKNHRITFDYIIGNGRMVFKGVGNFL
jgi:hypothetical protein